MPDISQEKLDWYECTVSALEMVRNCDSSHCDHCQARVDEVLQPIRRPLVSDEDWRRFISCRGVVDPKTFYDQYLALGLRKMADDIDRMNPDGGVGPMNAFKSIVVDHMRQRADEEDGAK